MQQPVRNGAKHGMSDSGSGVAAFMLELDALGVRVEERRLAGGLCGFYYAPMRLIVLDSELADFQRRCTLCHELIHAQYSDTGCGALAGIKAERRARRETALRLVDPVEYATAERVFEGDVWRIACELSVTVQVLEDFREVLRDVVMA